MARCSAARRERTDLDAIHCPRRRHVARVNRIGGCGDLCLHRSGDEYECEEKGCDTYSPHSSSGLREIG
jgi:hypothetical protein